MTLCPACSSELNDDFGLVDCPACGAALYIEFDGQVRRRDEARAEASPAAAMPEEAPEFIGDLQYQGEFAAEQGGEPDGNAKAMLSADAIEPEGIVAEVPSVVQEPAAEESVPMRPAPPVQVAEAEVVGSPLADLAAFGNSEESAARDGTYMYDVFVTGIDSGDLRAAVKEALTDPLFLWDVEEMLRPLRQGELKLSRVTAVKAALVVQRLGSLPVKIRWVQHALVGP